MRAASSITADPSAPINQEPRPDVPVTEFVRPAQVWKEIGCSPATGWRLVAKGVLHRPLKVGPNTTVFLRHKLENDKQAMLARAASATA